MPDGLRTARHFFGGRTLSVCSRWSQTAPPKGELIALPGAFSIHPIRFGYRKKLPLRGSCRRRRLRGFNCVPRIGCFLRPTLSVCSRWSQTAPPKGELIALPEAFVIHPVRFGYRKKLPLRGSCRRRRLRGFNCVPRIGCFLRPTLSVCSRWSQTAPPKGELIALPEAFVIHPVRFGYRKKLPLRGSCRRRRLRGSRREPLPSCRFASSHLPQGDGFWWWRQSFLLLLKH